MPPTPVVVGVDLGTTSAKALAYDTDGQVWASATREYPLSSPGPGRAEQDPDEIVDRMGEVLAAACKEASDRGARVVGVALSAAMHSLLAVDADGVPLTPALTYADSRATGQARALRETADGLALFRRTGTPLHPMSPLTKLCWFRQEDPDVFGAAARWLSLKEYALRRLLGADVVDHSIASATGLFNLRERDWDAEALAVAGVGREQLSRPVPTDSVLRDLDAAVADRLGLPAGTPVIVGAADGCLANLGVGAVVSEVAACTIGTSGAVRVATGAPDTDPEGRLFTYALTDDRWIVGGPVNNGGIVLRWLRDRLLPDVAEEAAAAGEEPYDRLTTLAAAAPPGADGLLFLPYLTGERAPHWNAAASGALVGLHLRHGREHVARAALEGVLLHLRSVVDALAALGIAPREVRASGGFTRSQLWVQMLADVLGRDIVVPREAEGTCLGAALLGMTAVGLVDSLEDAADTVSIASVRRPDAGAAAAYDRVHEVFTSLYDRVEGAFDDVAALRSDPPTA